MIRARDKVFVDTGAWLALAMDADPLHPRAAAIWQDLTAAQADLVTSLHIVIETFTFLQRNAHLDVAQQWLAALQTVPRLKRSDATSADLAACQPYFQKKLHKLSLADALSFVVMKRVGARAAFTFDHHFASAGFRMVG